MKIEIKPNDKRWCGKVLKSCSSNRIFKILDVGTTEVWAETEMGARLSLPLEYQFEEEPKKECSHSWKTNSTEGINIVKRFCTKCNEVDLGDIGNDYPKTGKESSVECDHEYSEGYIRLAGEDSTQDIRVCFKCKAIDYLKDIERELPKKNPKLLSPAITTFTDGRTIHYQVLPWLYDMESAERAKEKSERRGGKFIWPALDANGKPIQYLVEEE